MRTTPGFVAALLLFTNAAHSQSTSDLPALVAKLPSLEPAVREAALTAIADALLWCDDDDQRERANAGLREQAAEGLFCSPSATTPSLLWFQFVRAMRRSEVRTAGDAPSSLTATLDNLLARRSSLLPMIAQLARGADTAPDLHNLRAFGWHGAGELLEAVADLAEHHGEAARDAGTMLALFLEHEPIEPPTPHQEGGAGVGEALSPEVAAIQNPILWADGYRIALARAVIATRPPGIDLSTATLHLLYSPRRTDRLAAIDRLRKAPLAATAVPHLITRLGDDDRLVVREAITLLGGAGPVAAPAREALQRLATSADKEWRVLAARALELIGGR